MGKWVHILSDIDEKSRTAVCAACGPVTIRQRGLKRKDGSAYWRCNPGNKSGSWKGRNKRLYRRYLKENCDRCGFVPEAMRQLDIHHLDGDKTNNALDNLQTLCANCHRLV